MVVVVLRLDLFWVDAIFVVKMMRKGKEKEKKKNNSKDKNKNKTCLSSWEKILAHN